MTDDAFSPLAPNRKPLLLVAATMLFIFLALITSWLVFLPQRLAQHLKDDIQEHSGLVLDVAGASKLRFDHGLVVDMEDVSLAASGGQNIPLLTADHVRMPLTLGGFFDSGKRAREIFLDNPVLALGADGEGRKLVEANLKSLGPDAITETRPFKIVVGNGSAKMLFGKSGLGLNASDLNGDITWEPELGLTAALNGLLNGAPTQFAMTVDDGHRALADGSPAEISLTTREQQLSFSGRLRLADRVQLDGRMLGHGANLKGFANWLALGLHGFQASGVFDFESAISLAGDQIAFHDIKLNLGDSKGGGNASFTQTDGRPQFDAKLDFDVLDLGAYQRMNGAAEGHASPLIGGWSEQPMDFSDLGANDVTLALTSKSLLFAGLRSGAGHLNLTLKDKKLAGDMAVEKIEGGRFDARFGLDGQGATPGWALKINTADVAAARFLAATLGFSAVDGALNLKADVTATGADVAGVISTLKGDVAADVKKGRIVGVDLGKALAGSGAGWNLGAADVAGLATVASDIAVTAKLADGIAELQTATLQASGFAVAATGTIDLLRQQLDVVATPTLNPGGAALKLPLRVKVKGPWEAPTFDSGLDGDVLKPALRLINKAATGGVDDLGVGKIGKKAGKALKKLLGE